MNFLLLTPKSFSLSKSLKRFCYILICRIKTFSINSENSSKSPNPSNIQPHDRRKTNHQTIKIYWFIHKTFSKKINSQEIKHHMNFLKAKNSEKSHTHNLQKKLHKIPKHTNLHYELKIYFLQSSWHKTIL